MQVLIAISCLLAVASASYVHSAYNYPLVHGQHVPVIGPKGVPLDEPAVAHARAEHATAHAAAHARNGDGYGYAGHVAAPVVYASHYEGHYTGPQHIPVINHKGVPVDTPAVQAARAHHAATFEKIQARNGNEGYEYDAHVAAPVTYASHYEGHYSGPQHIPVINHKGVPVDTPAVQAARAHHAAVFAKAQAHNVDAHDISHVTSYSYAAHVAGSVDHSVPIDTPEVAHAKAAHFAAHAEASARNSVYQYAPLAHYRKRRDIYEYAAPVVDYGGHYAGAQHVPVIGVHGVPLDEPAVAHAKAEHAAAHAKAAARNDYVHAAGSVVSYAGHYSGPQHIPVINHKGVPVDEPAVQAARAHHAALFAEVQSRNGHTAGHYAAAGPVEYAGHYAYTGPQHIPVIGHNGVPLDEPAVAHARAEHAAAHAKASARNGDSHYAHPVVHTW